MIIITMAIVIMMTIAMVERSDDNNYNDGQKK